MDIQQIVEKIEKFRTDRDWKQFHNPKNLAIALSCEASEVIEYFMWKDLDESKKVLENPEKVAEFRQELADVGIYLLLLCKEAGVDLLEIIDEKIDINDKKYPVEKAKGTSKKYNQL